MNKNIVQHDEIRILQVFLEDGSEMLVWKSVQGQTRIKIIKDGIIIFNRELDTNIKSIKIKDSIGLEFIHK